MQDVLRRIRDAAEGCAKATGTEGKCRPLD